MTAFAPGSVHGGWRVSGPSPEGAPLRWPVERDGKSAMLTFFPSSGPRAALHRAIAERHAAWRSLEHPALERVDTGLVEGGAYVVLPPFERLSDAALPPAEALATLSQLLGALEAFHARKLAHGEVDAWSVVKRGDGVALLPPGLRPPPPGLETLGLQADPRYAAPEVLDGRPPTAEADVFSIGLVLFRLLTGQVPAQGTDPAEVLQARGAGAPDLGAARPGLPAPVVALYRCLVAPRGLRPADAAAASALVAQAARDVAPEVPVVDVRVPRPARVAGPFVLLLVLVAAGYALSVAIRERLALDSPADGFKFRVAAPDERRPPG
jgi:hypothetical protein